jgi:hypothetical protein
MLWARLLAYVTGRVNQEQGTTVTRLANRMTVFTFASCRTSAVPVPQMSGFRCAYQPLSRI